jgi:hypothetical protein
MLAIDEMASLQVPFPTCNKGHLDNNACMCYQSTQYEGKII